MEQRTNNTPEEDLEAAQERVAKFYEKLRVRDGKPNPLRRVIDECIANARPTDTQELPDTNE
jgi:hypothetical protein